jgi:hypothetical protein
MSLKITSDKIVIQNANNVEKFNSSQRLLYQIGYSTGSTSVSSTTNSRAILHGLSFDENKDIVTSFITITAGSGAIADNLVGLRQPAQGFVPIDFYARNVRNNAAIDSSWISAYVGRDYIFFVGHTSNYFNNFTTPLGTTQCTTNSEAAYIDRTISLNYEIFVYRYTE